MSVKQVCPSCGSLGMLVFYELKQVPVHSVLLLRTRKEALHYPKGDIVLGFCQACGCISNLAFDPGMHEYSSQYEATQAFSPTFNAFAHRLATRLIDQYDLHARDIIEIGCGQGEFLTILCELGGNRGVGFDPAYVSGRNDSEARGRITFIKDFYSEKYSNYHGDFICCRMTLEHIQHAADFVSTVRRSISDRSETTVFFQVPNVRRILRELAFWDIYYEHCSYFSLGSLARLFRKCGFDVIDLWMEYDDQYLMIGARPGHGKRTPPLAQEDAPEDLAPEVAYFSQHCGQKIEGWRYDLQKMRRSGRRVVIWGGGSKAVAFLTTLNLRDEIEYVVDINPSKHGTYIAGTGQEIVAPGFLREYEPGIVIVMNPIYQEEICQDLNRIGLAPELVMV